MSLSLKAEPEAIVACDMLNQRLSGYMHAMQSDPQARHAHIQSTFLKGELAPALRAISGDIQFLADSIHQASTVDWTVLVESNFTDGGKTQKVFILCIVAATTAQRAGDLVMSHMRHDSGVQKARAEDLGYYAPDWSYSHRHRVIRVTEIRRDEYIGEIPSTTEDGHALAGPLRISPRSPTQQAVRRHYDTSSMESVDIQEAHAMRRRIDMTSDSVDSPSSESVHPTRVAARNMKLLGQRG